MKNLKLIWVLVITIGGILIGMVLDDFLFELGNSYSIVNLAIGASFVLTGGWNIYKS